jgi:hypothetical protein
MCVEYIQCYCKQKHARTKFNNYKCRHFLSRYDDSGTEYVKKNKMCKAHT